MIRCKMYKLIGENQLQQHFSLYYLDRIAEIKNLQAGKKLFYS
ncbi:MAG: hypothetical protein WDO19_19165 [Bacteroidota bacterium]